LRARIDNVWRTKGPFDERLEVGSDFITDLRLQWIRHFRELGAGAPETVQLLGIRDGIVTRADSIDVTQFPNAEEIEIPGANHADIYRLDKAADEETRFKLIRDAFLKPIQAHAAARAGLH